MSAQNVDDPDPVIPESTEQPQPPNIVDRVHDSLTRRMVDSAERFDSFFDDERYIDEENKTTARLQIDTFLQEYEEVDFRIRGRLDLKVPALEDSLEKGFKLIISGDPEDNPNLDESDVDAPGPIEEPEEDQRNISVSGQYFFLDTLKRNASARAGVTFRGIEPVAFGEFRYKTEETFTGLTTARLIPRARWWTDRGWDLRADFDIERPFTENLFFRTTLAGSWREDREGFFYNLRYRFFQAIDKKRALEYEWINDFQTEPVHRLTRMTYRVRFRQEIWRKWLFYEVAPEVALREFGKASDYRFVPAILLRLEVRFERDEQQRRRQKK